MEDTCDGINSDGLQGILFEYVGQPHKIYAAQAVMSHLFTPACKFVKRLALGDGVRGYLFRDGQRTVAVAFNPKPKACAESWTCLPRSRTPSACG